MSEVPETECVVCGDPTVRSLDIKGYPVTVCWQCEGESEEFLTEKMEEVKS